MSERNIPVSATPFIHGPQDMATINCFIDPCMPASSKQWWKDSTTPGENNVKSVQQWRGSYFIRREKSLLAKELPVKTVSVKDVGSLGSELAVYREHEKSFFDALAAFSKLSKEHEDKRELVNFLFAQLTCMVRLIVILSCLNDKYINLTTLFFCGSIANEYDSSSSY